MTLKPIATPEQLAQLPTDDPVIRAHIMKLEETVMVLNRIAMLAVVKLGGGLRISEEDWKASETGDIQWRTVRMPGFEPEIHVAATMEGESIQVGGKPNARN